MFGFLDLFRSSSTPRTESVSPPCIASDSHKEMLGENYTPGSLGNDMKRGALRVEPKKLEFFIKTNTGDMKKSKRASANAALESARIALKSAEETRDDNQIGIAKEGIRTAQEGLKYLDIVDQDVKDAVRYQSLMLQKIGSFDFWAGTLSSRVPLSECVDDNGTSKLPFTFEELDKYIREHEAAAKNSLKNSFSASEGQEMDMKLEDNIREFEAVIRKDLIHGRKLRKKIAPDDVFYMDDDDDLGCDWPTLEQESNPNGSVLVPATCSR